MQSLFSVHLDATPPNCISEHATNTCLGTNANPKTCGIFFSNLKTDVFMIFPGIFHAKWRRRRRLFDCSFVRLWVWGSREVYKLT